MIPTDIGGLKLWLKADSLALSDGDPVATWADSSGLGNNATQGTSGFRPTFQTNELFGLPVVRFDGSDDYLTIPVSHSGTSLTVFIVAKRISGAGNNSGNASFFLSSTSADWNDTRNFVLAYNPSTILQAYRNGSLSTATHPGDGVTYLLVTKFDSSNHTAYLNGSAQSPVPSTGSFGFDTIFLGARYDGSAPFQRDNFDVGEFIVYDSALSDGDRGGIETYLQRWFIAPAAPSGPSFRPNKMRPAFFTPGLAR